MMHDHATPDETTLRGAPHPGDQLTVHLDFRTLRVEGEIDARTADRFENSLRFAFELGDPVCIDLSQVSFMGSSGVRALLRASDRRPVVIVRASPEVRHVLNLMELEEHFGLTTG